MSEQPPAPDPEQEQYAFAVTRKLFTYTFVGTILFSGIMIALWYWEA